MNDSTSPPTGGVDPALALRQMTRPIEHYMADDAVREIAIPRPGVLFLKKQGRWHFHTEPRLTLDFLQAFISAIASYNSVNFGPILSLRMPDGERVQVGQAPAVIDGTVSVNIRKHSSVVKTLDELEAEGAFDSWQNLSPPIRDEAVLSGQDRELLELLTAGRIKEFLHMAVQYCRNIIIGGKTGSGKTTFARSLIERVPTWERLITIEDVHELYLPNHPNRVHMIYGSGKGQISATDCIAACMRSSPDRIFLSELRGPEAWDYLNALNTGHPGSVTTTHSNSARDTFDRVALLVKQSPAGQEIDVQTLRQFLYSTLDISLYFANYKLTEVYFNPARVL
ncbi:P-type DNA transfer ATPase VirB11 [Achromobacter aegrifaciens]|uniref:P-type DNA transfer ATPase VirB11 n=1 Tax=Achromobacter aegrifaciens TaxID=1287736 RepID=UPI0027B9A78E|nr:P-type DNA transfer ATPase VirB11 [Achromobacter aegrifaciens]WLW63612.1 P-type DNA transfer ATPase VirB11 [Achromobacter aegrifaciens]